MDFNETNEKDKFDNFIISENPRIKRRNCDEILNCEGIKLIELCKSLDLIILNGRICGDQWGSYTHFNNNKGASTVDLAISSCDLFEKIKGFRVLPQSEISDHCKIILIMNIDVDNSCTQ